MQYLRANALELLGDLEDGIERYREAIDTSLKAERAYFLAKQLLHQDVARLARCRVMLKIGQRTQGTESIDMLANAIEDSESGLRRMERDFAPDACANAYLVLAKAYELKHDRDPAADPHNSYLFNAGFNLEKSLEYVKREESPLQWGRIQVGLGRVRFKDGKSSGEREMLEASAKAFAAARDIFQSLKHADEKKIQAALDEVEDALGRRKKKRFLGMF